MLNPIAAAQRIADEYRRYLESTFAPRRAWLRQELSDALRGEFRLTRGPFLEASPPFETGASVADLIDKGILTDAFRELPDGVFPIDRPLYIHQEVALRKAIKLRRNLVIATGTGSGKTECFLFPILDYLLREGSADSPISPGVRALLLYPMNALANDQMKRLRRLLRRFPNVTFGRYIGETLRDTAAAKEDFSRRYPGEPRLPNELISRNQMQTTPPHILLTNYAMLEYLLLRPEDSSLFDGPTGRFWRFVVLDEAHIYNGARGTEIAMLLRRLRDRVVTSERGRLQCFATGATLGKGKKDFPELAKFAESLFDEEFSWDPCDDSRQDIVGHSRKTLVRSDGEELCIPQELYREVQQVLRSANSTAQDIADRVLMVCNGVAKPWPNATKQSYLASILSQDARVVALQRRLETAALELDDAVSDIFTGPDAYKDLAALIDLCVAARHHADDAPVILARYHFFLRALEGAFVCPHPDHPGGAPRLRLSRHERCPVCADQGRQAAMFEMGVCRRCGAEYLVGRLEDNREYRVLKAASLGVPRLDYLLYGEPTREDEDDEDESAADSTETGAVDKCLLCPGCGAIFEQGQTPSCTCEGTQRPVPVTVAPVPLDATGLRRCPACCGRTNLNMVYRLYTGSEAPVSVIATDLYQALSKSHDASQAQKVGEGRKLLTFSDSRQDAAFFAPYLERTYHRAIQRRLICDAITGFFNEPPRTEDLVIPIRKRAEKSLVIDPDESTHKKNNMVLSWLLREILTVDRRQSLEGTGCAEITVAFPHQFRSPGALLDLGFSEEGVEDLLRLLLDTVRISGAVTIPDGVDIRDPIFAPRNVSLAIRANGSSAGILAWNPSRNSNRRLDLLEKVFNRKGIAKDPAEILDKIWHCFLTIPNGLWGRVLLSTQHPQEGVLWRLAWERFEFIPTSDEHRPLQCNTCGQLWWRTVDDVCPSYLCRGILSPVKDIERLLDDHYARLYTRLEPIGMVVQEHTAHWRAASASRIQDDFIRGDVNVLSCSTTFELGVDVGEVESVLLRNVPPSPANYIQRAGRAGRRTDAAALAVTFAQRRSWDLSFFDNPRAMVDGTISPPRLILDNAAIVRRHVHSIAFAAFERARGPHRTVKEFFSPDEGQPLPVEEFVAWLRTHPPELENALWRVVPTDSATRLGLENWTWVNALVEPTSDEPTHGWLARAREEVKEDLESISQLIEEAAQARDFRRADSLNRLLTTLQSRPLLPFLASRNILPKYGFPVDVVQLDVARPGDHQATEIDLSRDLAIAISEYAPGAKVVAAKSLWESTGLRILPGRALPGYAWAVCNDCGAFRHHLDRVADECSVCGGNSIAPGRRGKFVIPIFGFVGCRSKEKVGDARPPRQALTETFFGSYRDVPPPLETTPNLGGHVSVEKRFSRQGLIAIINRGPRGRGFRLCENCGFAMPAPPDAGQAGVNAGHPYARYPNRTCNAPLRFVHLGHEYLTDVLEIRVAFPMTPEQARSTLYALLEGTLKFDIAREDVDGTLCPYAPGQSPAFIIFDAVPGGAGYAQILGSRLKDLFLAALERVTRCECGEETSCYNCLRSYTNQIWHETLSRGAAARILQVILGKGDQRQLELLAGDD